MFKIGSIFIPVKNIESSRKWYEENLGVTLIDSWEDGAGFYLPYGSTQLALIKVESSQTTEFYINSEQKNSYYNFVVEDIEIAHIYFRKNNVITTDINDFGGMKYFEFFDLDGNPFSVVNEVEDSPFHSDQIKKLQEGNLKYKL